MIPATQYKDGEITHSFKKGKLKILMEATPSGKVVVLIEPLESNTSIGSVSVDAKRQSLSFMMLVKDNNPDFASWTDAEPLTVVLDPTLVTEITLQGKEIKSEGNITILIPDL